jgi:hypothetical protein
LLDLGVVLLALYLGITELLGEAALDVGDCLLGRSLGEGCEVRNNRVAKDCSI